MSGGLVVKVDTSSFANTKLGFAKGASTVALARAINHTGDKATTAMTRALVPQTGLQRRTIVKALRKDKAGKGGLTYTIRSKGGNIRLKYFKPRETAQGVSAAPWNKRGIYPHTFLKAGWWPRRVVKSNWNGQVFERLSSKTNSGLDRFEVKKSGLYLPDEMVQGASAAAFNGVVDRELPARLEHEVGRMLGG